MKIKIILKAVFIVLSLMTMAQEQTYTVIHTIGKIKNVGTGEYLAKGSRVSSSANLAFETTGARAAVLSSSRGRFVVQQQSSASSSGDLTYALASVISPARGRLSTRAGGINNKLDFEKHFGEGPIAMLNGVYKTSVSPTAYPVNDSQFFYAQYQYNGEAINKRLSSEGDVLVFDGEQFFSVDNKPIESSETTDMKLFYYNASAQESTMVTILDLAMVGADDLKSIVDQFPNDSAAQLEVINSLYGKCSEEALNKALAEE